jgi:hypothetical protein
MAKLYVCPKFSSKFSYYHLVLKVNCDNALDWSDDEIIERWYQLYHG